MQIINPATEESIREIVPATSPLIEQRFSAAKKAQGKWKQLSVSNRLEKIKSFGKLLNSRKDELAETLTKEMGKPIKQSLAEISGASSRIDFFIENAAKWLNEEWMHREAGLGEKISYEPLGVVANISAWNYPYLIGVNVFIPALITGNAVMYKPSEYTALTGLAIEETLHKAGIPKFVFNALVGGKEAGAKLLHLPLDGYFFTGSYKTGKHIYEVVSQRMVPCQLELGGKDPLYVSGDNSQVGNVAEAVAEGIFYNTGQSCCAVERVYVNEKVYDEFLSHFLQVTENWKPGDPMDENTALGPLTRKAQLDWLEYQVKDALKKGAKLEVGGKRIKQKGYFFEPTVMTSVDHSMSLMREETFGPVIGIQKVKDDQEAVHLMQDTEYGLTGAVYSDHLETAMPILEALNTGTVYWNCCDRVSVRLPWSGRKHSGIGSTLSYQGIRAFLKPKAYHLRGNLS